MVIPAPVMPDEFVRYGQESKFKTPTLQTREGRPPAEIVGDVHAAWVQAGYGCPVGGWKQLWQVTGNWRTVRILGTEVSKFSLANTVAVFLWLVLLESNWLSRPLVFLVGPLIVLTCIYFLAPPLPGDRWKRLIAFTLLASVLGFLLMRFVFV